MAPYLNKDELHIIFKFLNGLDLHSASQVCRFWSEIAKEENKKRSPTCVVKNELEIYPSSWKNIKRDFIDCCHVKPSLHMLYFICDGIKHLPKGCHCQYLPLNCISISVKQSFSSLIDNNISSIFFPDIPNIQISTITLNKHPWDKGLYCEELKCIIDDSFRNADRLKTIFEPIINNSSPTTNCAVIIYGTYDDYVALNFAVCLENWFRNERISIWSLNVDELSICNYVYNSHVCQHNANCIAILLSGTDMQSWTLNLDNDSLDERMQEFKEKIKLKKHTIAFVGCGKNGYYNIEDNIFERYFPNIPIYQIYGHEAIAKDDLNEIYVSLNDPYEREETTALMLLTYN